MKVDGPDHPCGIVEKQLLFLDEIERRLRSWCSRIEFYVCCRKAA